MSNEWSQKLKVAEEKSDFEDRQAKIDRISSDPKGYYAPPVKKPYKTTEMHYIFCVDEENANLSMPEAGDIYNTPHKLAGMLISDRAEIPLGWAKAPPRGTSIDAIKESYPEIFDILTSKKVTNF